MKVLFAYLGILVLAAASMSFAVSRDWVPFETNGCRILFPDKPTAQNQTTKTAVGDVDIHFYLYEPADSLKDDNLVYTLAETAYPDSVINSNDAKSKVDGFFDGAVSGAAKNVNGQIISQTDIQLGGYPGKAVKYEMTAESAVINMHIYLVRNTMYLLQVITYKKNDGNASINKFMDSFSLKTP